VDRLANFNMTVADNKIEWECPAQKAKMAIRRANPPYKTLVLFNLCWLTYGIIFGVLIFREEHSLGMAARAVAFSIGISTFVTVLAIVGEHFEIKQAPRCSIGPRGLFLNGNASTWDHTVGFNISDSSSIEGARDLNLKRSLRGKSYWIKASYNLSDVDEPALRTLLQGRIEYVAFPADGSDPFAFPPLNLSEVRKSLKSTSYAWLVSAACVAITGAFTHFRIDTGPLGFAIIILGLILFASTALLVLDAARIYRMKRQGAADVKLN